MKTSIFWYLCCGLLLVGSVQVASAEGGYANNSTSADMVGGDGQFSGAGDVAVDSADTVAPTTPAATMLPGRPFNGPHNVPGIVQAEDYDRGDNTLPVPQPGTYADTTAGNAGGEYRTDDVDIERGGSGYDVGWIINGEYLTYAVDAAASGDYTIEIRASNPDAVAKTVTVSSWCSEFHGPPTTISVASTGSFDTYTTFTSAGTLNLNGGRNVVTVAFGASRMNLDSITIRNDAVQSLQAAFTVNTETVQAGQPVIGTDASIGYPQAWHWDFGDGSAAARTRNIDHRYSAPGSYTLSLRVMHGSQVSTASRTITVTPGLLRADFQAGTTPGSTLVRITDTSVNAATVRYDLGDGVASRNIPANGPTLSYYYSAAGTYTITQTATNATGETATKQMNVTVGSAPETPVGTPYNGPHQIPGILQAEDYDLGGEGIAYHDTSAGNEGGAYRHDDVDIETAGGITDVGWIRDGEWLTYTVNVTQAGTYAVSARVASPNSGRTVAISIDGRSQTTITVPKTGSFDTYMTATPPTMYADLPPQTPIPGPTGVSFPAPISLTAGTHVLKLTFQGDGQNLDWIAFASFVTPTPMP